MFPSFNLFGKVVPMYGTMAVIGALFAACLSMKLAKKTANNSEDVLYMLIYAGIGCLIGAKVLYIITSDDFHWDSGSSFINNIKYWIITQVSGGFVFYGGLIGAFLGAVRFTTKYKLPTFSMLETAVPAVPLFHAFGRIGCFCAGCCYGCETDSSFCVTFSHSQFAPNNINLVPVQLIESGMNLILSIILVMVFLLYKTRKNGFLSGIYISVYSVMRFVLEFYRGDAIRGSLWIFSSSQWISLILFPIGIILIIKSLKHYDKH